MSVPLDHPARTKLRAWATLRAELRARAGHRCECTGECGLRHTAPCCSERDGEDALLARGRIVLTMAHLCGADAAVS